MININSIKESIQKIKELVKNPEWQKLRKSFEGTWTKNYQSNCFKLRDYLGDMKDEKKLRIVMNYLTGTGFRTGKIKHKCISKLRLDISKHLKKVKTEGFNLDNYLNYIQEDGSINEDAWSVSGISIILNNLLQNVMFFLLYSSGYNRQSMLDSELSKKIKSITNKDVQVKVIKFNMPDAFNYGKNIYVTDKTIKILSERELIAILLHETKHSIGYHSYIANISGLSFFSTIVAILTKAMTKYKIKENSLFASLFVLSVLMIKFLTTATINIFIKRKMEESSDKFATKFGYGKELISALTKLINFYKKRKPKCNTIICKTWIKINDLIAAHPTLEKRVKKILESDKLQKEKLSKSEIKELVYKTI